MTRAIAETGRRREKQIAHNKAHIITFQGIHKSAQDMLERARPMPTKRKGAKVVLQTVITWRWRLM